MNSHQNVAKEQEVFSRPSVAVIGVNAFGIHIANILKMRKMAGVRYYMAIGDDTDVLHESTADTKIYLAPHSESAIQQLGKDVISLLRGSDIVLVVAEFNGKAPCVDVAGIVMHSAQVSGAIPIKILSPRFWTGGVVKMIEHRFTTGGHDLMEFARETFSKYGLLSMIEHEASGSR